MKLDIIKNALETNPNIIVINPTTNPRKFYTQRGQRFEKFAKGLFDKRMISVREYKVEEYRHGKLQDSYSTDFVVAPKNSIYDAEELNRFMDSLVPELQPDERVEFTVRKNGDFVNCMSLYFGELTFTEKIGERRVIIDTETIENVIDEELAKLLGFQDPKKTTEHRDYTQDILWKTHIIPYPNESCAKNWPMDIGIPLKTLRNNLPKKDFLYCKVY